MNEKISNLLSFVYGSETAAQIAPQIEALVNEFAAKLPPKPSLQPYFDETDIILITYGDMVQSEEERPLRTLRHFLESHIAGLVKGVHLLPFYPYSSDDGFSVIDYLKVDPALGDWNDVEAFGENFRLMFDAVINHISQHSRWFQRFLAGEEPYTQYFKTVDPSTDLSAVFRPRALPLLTAVETAQGIQHVWTTFSADQVDLNYETPALLLVVLRVLLTYVEHGAELIRLDAIGFMWKEIGTRSLHQPQTHALIQLMRALLDEVAPQVALVTETNVPHAENISYFGDGRNEAQMVYNFSLPPLMLHAFHTGNAEALSQWASTLDVPSPQTAFFNFLASHDGIGLTPARGILAEIEIEQMAERVKQLGGFVSYKTNSDGSQSAYELNVNYLDALGNPNVEENETLKAQRFLTSQAIMLALRGVPGIYFHSLFGSQNWRAGVAQTGQNRTINREKLTAERLDNELTTGLRHQVFTGYKQLLQLRTAHIAFHPQGEQVIHQLYPAAFVVERRYQGETIYCLHNVSAESITIPLPTALTNHLVEDLLSGATLNHPTTVELAPYRILWLKPL